MKNKRIARSISFNLIIITALLGYTSARAAGEILDPSFGTNGVVTANFDGVSSMFLQSNGRILLLAYKQGQPSALLRYNSNGSVDTTFGTNGTLTLPFGHKVAVQSDGKVVVAGSDNNRLALARYNNNGTSLDSTFGTNGVTVLPSDLGTSRYSLSDLAIGSDDRIVVVGTESNQGNFINLVIARLNSDGTLFATDFSGGLFILDKYYFPNNRYNSGQAIAIQSDGKLVASGSMMDNDAEGQISLVRLNQDSTLDASGFGTNGKGTVTAAVSAFHYHKSSMILQADGKIIVIGTASDGDDLVNDLVAARFNSNGALDTTFGGTGIVITDFGANEFGADVDLQTDGKIVVVGTSSTNLMIVRYNSSGSLDSSFGDGGKLIGGPGAGPSSGAEVKIQPDGKVLVAGSLNGIAFLARYIVDVASHPTTTLSLKSSGGHDGHILESAENSSVGGGLNSSATTFNVGDDQNDKQYRGLISFNTGLLPDTAIVTSARLEIKRQGLVGTDPFTTHGSLLLDIKSGTFNNNLVLELADFNAAATPGIIQEQILPVPVSWYTLQLNNANLGFINKVGLTQFRLRFASDDNDDMGADYLKFFSGNSTDANIPKLVITYFVP